MPKPPPDAPEPWLPTQATVTSCRFQFARMNTLHPRHPDPGQVPHHLRLLRPRPPLLGRVPVPHRHPPERIHHHPLQPPQPLTERPHLRPHGRSHPVPPHRHRHRRLHPPLPRLAPHPPLLQPLNPSPRPSALACHLLGDLRRRSCQPPGDAQNCRSPTKTRPNELKNTWRDYPLRFGKIEEAEKKTPEPSPGLRRNSFRLRILPVTPLLSRFYDPPQAHLNKIKGFTEKQPGGGTPHAQAVDLRSVTTPSAPGPKRPPTRTA